MSAGRRRIPRPCERPCVDAARRPVLTQVHRRLDVAAGRAELQQSDPSRRAAGCPQIARHVDGMAVVGRHAIHGHIPVVPVHSPVNPLLLRVEIVAQGDARIRVSRTFGVRLAPPRIAIRRVRVRPRSGIAGVRTNVPQEDPLPVGLRGIQYAIRPRSRRLPRRHVVGYPDPEQTEAHNSQRGGNVNRCALQRRTKRSHVRRAKVVISRWPDARQPERGDTAPARQKRFPVAIVAAGHVVADTGDRLDVPIANRRHSAGAPPVGSH